MPKWDKLFNRNTKQTSDFMDGLLGTELSEMTSKYSSLLKTQKSSHDFQGFFSPTDNLMNAKGTGNSFRPSIEELHSMSLYRIGPGYALTHGFADDALRNGFNFVNSDNKVVKRNAIFKWMYKTDFANQAILAHGYDRAYGIGFLLKFWKDNEDMSTPAPRSPPKRYKALSPLYMAPMNTYDTRDITFDESQWVFQGGSIRPSKVHPSRLMLFRNRPYIEDWRGLSVLEPVWLYMIGLMNSMISSVKGLAKWGMTIPIYKMGVSGDTKKGYRKYLSMMQEYMANYFFLVGRDDELDFVDSKIGKGITEIMEILKEDISSGTSIPLNRLYGRSASSGIGGEGALTAERTYLNTINNDQNKVTDNYLNEFRAYGFDIDGLTLDWNLAIQKTKEQRLQEEYQIIQNGIAKEQLSMVKQQNKLMRMQNTIFKESKDQYSSQQQIETAETISDFNKLQTISDYLNKNNNFINSSYDFVQTMNQRIKETQK